jgi:hypothetical protein
VPGQRPARDAQPLQLRQQQQLHVDRVECTREVKTQESNYSLSCCCLRLPPAACAVPTAVEQPWRLQKPNCEDGSPFIFRRCFSRSDFAKILSTLDRGERIDTGRYDAGSFLSLPLPLYTGVIFPTFSPAGTAPVAKETLHMCAMGAASTSMPFFNTSTGMVSTSSAPVGLRLRMVFTIFPALAKEKLKGLLELGHFSEVASVCL